MGNAIAMLIVGGLAIAFQISVGVALGGQSKYSKEVLSRRDEEPGKFWFAIVGQVVGVVLIALFLSGHR